MSENASKSERDAAEAMTQTARDLLVKQVNRRIPRANGLFDAEDARDDEIEDVEIESSDEEGEKTRMRWIRRRSGRSRRRKRADEKEKQSGCCFEEDDDEDEDDGEASESEDVEIDDDEDGPGLDDKILDKFGRRRQRGRRRR